jgi:hypothetical protein
VFWCGQSLQLALHSKQHPLAATVLYYGTPLVTDKHELSKIKWPVLGIFGDHDLANPLPLINAFKAALDNGGITNEIIIYKGLGHAFANPSGANYAPQQTADAWQKTLKFLNKHLSDRRKLSIIITACQAQYSSLYLSINRNYEIQIQTSYWSDSNSDFLFMSKSLFAFVLVAENVSQCEI